METLFNPAPIQLTKCPFVSIGKTDKIEFICIGRFDSNKRIDDVVRAFLNFEKSGGKGRLKVITDKGGEEIMGELIESHPRCAVELSFEYGSVDRESTFQLIENSHVLISWSQYETLGMTILEALSLGRPVIASNSGGAQDLVNDQNG